MSTRVTRASVVSVQEVPSGQVSRIREALESRPAVLAAVVLDLFRRPPLILHAWEPRIGGGVKPWRFTVVRRDVFGDVVLKVEPSSGEGNAGPWVLSTGSRGVFSSVQVLDLVAVVGMRRGEGRPPSYHTVLERVDGLLAGYGFHLLDHRFPVVVFGPWVATRDDEYRRVVKRPDPGMGRLFEVVVSAIRTGGWRWKVVSDGDLLDTGRSELAVEGQGLADRSLVRLGYNLARPTSFGEL